MALLLGAFFGGFLGYYRDIPWMVDAALPHADGMVIFTGGSNRVATGVDLVANGFTGPVLITGAHPAVSLERLFASRPEALHPAQVDVDYTAMTTRGNVRETLAWAKRHDLHTVLVVTSNYHVPRSLMLLKRDAPQLNIVMYPVLSEHINERLLMSEYLKYLAARLRLDRW